MIHFIINRILWLIPVVITVAAVTFFLMYRAPGGPWDREKPLPQTTVDQLNRKFNLDKPRWLNTSGVEDQIDDGVSNPLTLGKTLVDTQFFHYLTNVFQGDLGPTYASRGSESVQSLIAKKFPVSLKLGVVAVLFAIVVGIPLGRGGGPAPELHGRLCMHVRVDPGGGGPELCQWTDPIDLYEPPPTYFADSPSR